MSAKLKEELRTALFTYSLVFLFREVWKSGDDSKAAPLSGTLGAVAEEVLSLIDESPLIAEQRAQVRFLGEYFTHAGDWHAMERCMGSQLQTLGITEKDIERMRAAVHQVIASPEMVDIHKVLTQRSADE